MTELDEPARLALYRAAEQSLGHTQANTLMSLLPPVGWADVATKDDLRQLEERLDARMDARFSDLDARLERRFSGIDGRFAGIDIRFAEIDGRFAQIDGRFIHIEGRFGQIDGRFAVLESRIDEFEAQMDGRFAQLDLRFSELESRFGSRLDRALREQTRTLMVGLVGSLATMTSLSLGAVMLTG